jgi:hypothetical protein
MNAEFCKNEACAHYGIPATAQEHYWMKVDVTDFTGTLQDCVVNGKFEIFLILIRTKV